MADPNDVQQATIERWQRLNHELEQAIKNLDRLKGTTGASSDAVNRAGQEADAASDRVRKFYQSLSHTERMFLDSTAAGRKMEKQTHALNEKISDLRKSASGAGIGLKNLAGGALGAAASAAIFGTSAKSAFNPLGDTAKVMDRMSGAMRKLGLSKSMVARGLGMLGAALKNANDVFRQYHTTLSVATALGSKFGKNVNALQPITVGFSRSLEDMSAAFGFSVPEINRAVDAARNVPGVFEEMTNASESSAEAGKGLMGAMLALKGAGMPAAEAGRLLDQRYQQFGETGIKVVEQLSAMVNVAGKMGVSTELAREQITRASAPLAIFGRKSADAAASWKTFMSALGNQVPIQEVSRMLSDLTGRIASMSVENRAFLSMVSGAGRGMGALGGALRMELELRREGGLEKSIDMLMKTITRFGGGRVVTLEQAARDPGLAMQFEVQRRMLGQLVGVQGQSAARMLEVLQGVQQGGVSQLEASKSIRNLTMRGSRLQQESVSKGDRWQQATLRTADLMDELVKVESHSGKAIEDMARDLRRDVRGGGTFLTGKNIRRAAAGTGEAMSAFAGGLPDLADKAVALMSDVARAGRQEHRRVVGEPVRAERPPRRVELVPRATVEAPRRRDAGGGRTELVPMPGAAGLFTGRRERSAFPMFPERRRIDDTMRPVAAADRGDILAGDVRVVGRTEEARQRREFAENMRAAQQRPRPGGEPEPIQIAINATCAQCKSELEKQIVEVRNNAHGTGRG